MCWSMLCVAKTLFYIHLMKCRPVNFMQEIESCMKLKHSIKGGADGPTEPRSSS